MQACFWQPSRILYLLHMGLAALALPALAASSLPGWACWTAAGWVVVWMLWRSLRQPRCTRAGYRRGLRHDRQQGWQLWQANTGWQPVCILPGTLVRLHLVVLRYRLAGSRQTQSLAVPADVLPAYSHRRLRVALRLIPLQDRAATPSRGPDRPADAAGSPA